MLHVSVRKEHHQALQYTIWNISHCASRCFEICEILRILKTFTKIFYICYIRDSVHRSSRLKKSSEMQQNADIYLLLNYRTCFGRPSHPLSGVHKTAVAAFGTDHTIWGASYLKRGHVWGSLLPISYDLYHRLRLELYVLLMTGAMDARNV